MKYKSLTREVFSFPLLILGAVFLSIGEFISGSKHTYRGNEVIELMKSKMICSKCGHMGSHKQL